jgi:hypothetical protein
MQPTPTFIMRLLNMRVACVTCGSDAATMDAMAQIGSVLAMCSITYHTMMVAIATLKANRMPTMSCRISSNHFMPRMLSPAYPLRASDR